MLSVYVFFVRVSRTEMDVFWFLPSFSFTCFFMLHYMLRARSSVAQLDHISPMQCGKEIMVKDVKPVSEEMYIM